VKLITHSPSSSVEVKNRRGYMFTSPYAFMTHTGITLIYTLALPTARRLMFRPYKISLRNTRFFSGAGIATFYGLDGPGIESRW
jgi:hypothetical protein